MKIAKHQTETGSSRYIDVLPALVKAYNETYHETIKMSPTEATQHLDVDEIRDNIINKVQTNLDRLPRNTVDPLKPGDKVRIALITDAAIRRDMGSLGRKSALAQWSVAIYTVKTVSKPKLNDVIVGSNLEQYRIVAVDPANDPYNVARRIYRRNNLQAVNEARLQKRNLLKDRKSVV